MAVKAPKLASPKKYCGIFREHFDGLSSNSLFRSEVKDRSIVKRQIVIITGQTNSAVNPAHQPHLAQIIEVLANGLYRDIECCRDLGAGQYAVRLVQAIHDLLLTRRKVHFLLFDAPIN